MNYHIRDAVKQDMEQVLNLITELAIFEKEPDAVEITTADLQAKGFGSSPEFHCFVAESDQKIIGIALAAISFAAVASISLSSIFVAVSFGAAFALAAPD